MYKKSTALFDLVDSDPNFLEGILGVTQKGKKAQPVSNLNL